MTQWRNYRVTLRLRSPLHVGRGKVGNLQLTRRYVPGRSVWGALAAGLVAAGEVDDYRRAGQLVSEQLALSYFYLSTLPEKVTCWPWDDGFAWQFMGSWSGTALEGGRAADGTLHEVEYIAPRTRDCEPVYLIGHIFERVGVALPWQGLLAHLQLGGEQTYGWGQLSLHGRPQEVGDCFAYQTSISEDRPTVLAEAAKPFLAHAKLSSLTCQGDVEPLVGRETDAVRAYFGRNVAFVGVCWAPGSCDPNADHWFIVGEKGVWQSEQLGFASSSVP